VGELESEAAKAREFKPPLGLFIVATTAPANEKIQTRARELTVENEKEGRFELQVFAWEKIWHEIYDRRDLRIRLGRKYWPMLFEGAGDQKITPTRLTHVAEQLFGRATERAMLDAA